MGVVDDGVGVIFFFDMDLFDFFFFRRHTFRNSPGPSLSMNPSSSPTLRLAPSPKTPKPEQLRRSMVNGPQSPLHALMLGRFSPLSLSRSTML
jgi:hypothetical protein